MTPLDIRVADTVASLVHSKKLCIAAKLVADYCKISGFKLKDDDKPEKAHPTLLMFLHNILEKGGAQQAAKILWTKNQFSPDPQSVKDIWKLYEESDQFLIMGAASMGKSFSVGVRLFLEWVRDPEYTTVRVLGPSEDHLEQNLFSHLVALHTNASLPMPGEVGELFIGLNRRDQLSSISGVVIPKGNVKKAGRLQGGKRRPRPKPHPLFGPLSRMFIFVDEIENVPNGIWQDVNNVLSNLDKTYKGFKIGGAYNPSNQGDEVAARAEPPFGWPGVDPEVHFRWRSTRGWEVLRLDGEKCENVIEGKEIYPGMQTRFGLEQIAANSGGRNSPGYQTMGRGCYPTMGLEATIIPAGMLPKARGEFIWWEAPQPVGAVDLALEGGDDAVYTIGKFGKATGVKYPPSLEFPQGRTVMFKDKRGQVQPRWGLIAEQQFVLPKGETVSMKQSVMDTNRKAGVRPEFFACDRTGHGAGVADLIKYEWSTIIQDVNYSAGAGEEKLMQEDSKNCNELYGRMASLLWFATRQWLEFGYFLLHPGLDLGKLNQQLTQRRYRIASGKSNVESKKDYESRGFGSPNEADSLTLLVHAARKGSGLVLSMRGDSVDLPGSADMDDWPGAEQKFCDVSNTTDYLDTSEKKPWDMGEPAIL
jgi:hypothetical protein